MLVLGVGRTIERTRNRNIYIPSASYDNDDDDNFLLNNQIQQAKQNKKQ